MNSIIGLGIMGTASMGIIWFNSGIQPDNTGMSNQPSTLENVLIDTVGTEQSVPEDKVESVFQTDSSHFQKYTSDESPVIMDENDTSESDLSPEPTLTESKTLREEPSLPTYAPVNQEINTHKEKSDAGNPCRQITCTSTNSQQLENTDSGLEEVSNFKYNDGMWAKIQRNGQFGMINQQGKIVVPVKYDEIANRFSYNQKTWCLVKANGKVGFINQEGIEIVPTIYDKVLDLTENDGIWARVENDGLVGFIDYKGEVVVPVIYDAIRKFHENDKLWVVIQKDGLYGFMDRSGKIVVPTIYDEVRDFNELDKNWARVMKDGLFGFIDLNGKEIVKPSYDKVSDFTMNDKLWMKVERGGNIYFLDINGKEIEIR